MKDSPLGVCLSYLDANVDHAIRFIANFAITFLVSFCVIFCVLMSLVIIFCLVRDKITATKIKTGSDVNVNPIDNTGS